MKSELKAKFIQHLLSKKKGNEGFTLIELLVVIIIIGILAAIALPSFLNQANKARQSEAQTYAGSVNRAQQAYYLEKTAFAANTADLEVGIPASTDYYTYAVTGASATDVSFTATPKADTKVRGYTGFTWIAATTNGATTNARVCEGKPGALPTTCNATTSTP